MVNTMEGQTPVRVPVLLLIFNRPATTKRVFEAIRRERPSKLYVAADGPRANIAGEQELVNEARRVATNVDWECDLQTLFRTDNLGCKKAVESAISWFFAHEPEGIILEDDCLPNHSFFQYCEHLLMRYRDDERIMLISGTNVAGEWKSDQQSYHFSYYGGIWGWASWRRAWQLYDPDMKLYGDPDVMVRMKDVLCNIGQYRWRRIFLEMVLRGEIDAWDYPWWFARIINSGLAIVPCRNLISNIGFGASSTHTKSQHNPLAELERHELDFPLKEPVCITVDRDYDRHLFCRNTRNGLVRLLIRVPPVYRLIRHIYYRALKVIT